MVKKISIVEKNEQIVDRYLSFIQSKLPEKELKRNNDFSGKNFGHSIYLKDSDYENVKGTLYDIKKALTDANFELVSVEYDDFSALSTYNYEKDEFGFVVKVKVTFDEADFDGAECRVTVTVEDKPLDIKPDKLEEVYDPNWLDKADDPDLILLLSELEELNMNTELLYNTVRRSKDKSDAHEVNSLIAFLKRINSDMSDTIDSWKD